MTDPSPNSRKGPVRSKSAMALLLSSLLLGSLVLSITPVQQASAIVATSIFIDAQSVVISDTTLVTIRGSLIDDVDYPNVNLTNQEIHFELDGEPIDFGSPVLTINDFGDFGPPFPTFEAPSEAGYWNLTAYFDGDANYLPSSGSTVFATAELGAMNYTVTDGQTDYFDVLLPLTDFNFTASLEFESVQTDWFSFLGEPIEILVSQCTSTDPYSRSLPLSFDTIENNGNICLELFPGPLQRFDDNAGIWVNISYAGIEDLPDGYSDDDIDLFHYNTLTGELTEITASRNTDTQEISGRALDVGQYFVAIGLHGDPSEGAVRQHIFLGDNQQVMFRNITDLSNATASVLSISPDEITIEEPVSITLNYSNGNLDVDSIDTLTVQINSTSSTPDLVTIEFTENATNSGIFSGSLTLTAGATSGSSLHANEDDLLTFVIPDKEATDGRFRAIIDGVTEAGVIELSDYEIDGAELDDLVLNVGFVPVIGIVNMTIVDASLDEFDGQINVTMSYANGLIGSDPSVLEIYHKEPGSGWDTTPPAAEVDTANMLVSATFDTTNPGLFALAFLTGSPGGAGGGLGRPGVGVVLDFLAPYANAPSSPSDEDSEGSGGGSGSRRVVIVNEQTDSFSDTHFEDNPLDRVQVSNTAFRNSAGTSVSSARVGQQISIAGTFTNQQQQSQEYSFIVLIIDKDGFAIDIAWQEGIVEAGETVDLSSSWMPENDGNYIIKIFVWDGLESPTPLSGVVVNQLSVV